MKSKRRVVDVEIENESDLMEFLEKENKPIYMRGMNIAYLLGIITGELIMFFVVTMALK